MVFIYIYYIYRYTYIYLYHQNQPNSNVGKYNSLMDPMANFFFRSQQNKSRKLHWHLFALFLRTTSVQWGVSACRGPQNMEIIWFTSWWGPKTWRLPKKLRKSWRVLKKLINMESPKKLRSAFFFESWSSSISDLILSTVLHVCSATSVFEDQPSELKVPLILWVYMTHTFYPPIGRK